MSCIGQHECELRGRLDLPLQYFKGSMKGLYMAFVMTCSTIQRLVNGKAQFLQSIWLFNVGFCPQTLRLQDPIGF